MRTKNNHRRRSWLLALLPVTLITVLVGGCFFGTPYVCYEGERLCDDTLVIECFYNEWIVLEDCYDESCYGTCRYLSNSEPFCACTWSEPWLNKS